VLQQSWDSKSSPSNIRYAFTALKDSEDVFCPAIGYFTNSETTLEPRPLYKNDSQMCKFVEHSCCRADEMNQIKEWWESKPNFTERSRYETKRERLFQIAAFTNDLIRKRDLLESYARKIQSESEKYQGYCLDYANKFLSLDLKGLDGYMDQAGKCWKTINSIQNSVMCLACEPYAQTILDFEEKRLIFGNATLRLFSDGCGKLAWTMHKELLPYFNTLNRLLKCDMQTAAESNDVMILNYNADGKVYPGELVGNSIEDTLIDEQMIPSFFSFGTRINTNIEGNLEYLILLEKIVNKYLPKNSEVSADVEARPVTEVIEKPKPNSNVQTIDPLPEVQKPETHELVSEPVTPTTAAAANSSKKAVVPKDEDPPIQHRKYKNMITKEVAIEILTDFVDKQEKENKTVKQIKAHLSQKKDDLEMSDNIDGDAILAIKDYVYDRITAEEALKQLNAKVKEFKSAGKETKVQENNLETLKLGLVKKVRTNEPYVFLKKLKAWHWDRPIDAKEIQREVDLAVDKSDLAYIHSQSDLKRPYAHREAKEMQRLAYEEQKEKFMEKVHVLHPDRDPSFAVKPFEFKQFLSRIEIKERIAFAYLQLNVKTKDIERYESYLNEYRHRDEGQKADNISSLLGRRLGKGSPRRLKDSNNPKDTEEMKKINFGVDFTGFRGFIDEEEKKNKNVKDTNHNKNQTMKERYGLAFRAVLFDYRSAGDNEEKFTENYPAGKVKTNILKFIQCADWDETMKKEEEKLLDNKNSDKDFELVELPGDGSVKKDGNSEKNGNKCLDAKGDKMKEIKAYFAAKVKKVTKHKKGCDDYGEEECQFFINVVKPMKYFWENCFESDENGIVDDSKCRPGRRLSLVGASRPSLGTNRILSSNLLKKSMKHFDKNFNRKIFQSKSDYRRLRKLYKKKFIERRLSKEGQNIRVEVQKDAGFDIGKLGSLENSTGFTTLVIDYQAVMDADIGKLLESVKEEDVNPIDELEEVLRETEEDAIVDAKKVEKIGGQEVEAFERLRLDGDVPMKAAAGSIWIGATAGLALMGWNLAVA